MGRLVIVTACLLAGTSFVGAMLWPAAALLVQCLGENPAADPQSILGARNFLLLGRTLLLVGISTFLSIVIGLIAAPALAGGRRRFTLMVCLVVLFCPPMIYAFGWQRVLPAGLDAHIACVLVWSLWCWPIAAVIVASGLKGVRSGYEAALLSTNRAGAYVRIVVPALVPQIVLSALVIGALLLGEYTTPHANGLVVYATELLGWATSSPDVIDTVIAALPLLAVMAGLLASACLIMAHDRHLARDDSSFDSAIPATLFPIAGLGLISAVLPIAALVLKLSGASAFATAMQTYGWDTFASAAVGAAGGGCAVAFAVAIGWLPRARKLVIFITVFFGVVPGAMVGEALIAAYNRPALAWIYDQWLIVALAYVARFAWMGALAGWLLARDGRGELASQAAVDGASRAEVLFQVTLPQHRALLGGVAIVVLALSLAEVASTSMVRVPAFSPISQVIIEKFHRFEDDMLISLSLLLIAASAMAAMVLGSGRREHERGVM